MVGALSTLPGAGSGVADGLAGATRPQGCLSAGLHTQVCCPLYVQRLGVETAREPSADGTMRSAGHSVPTGQGGKGGDL